MNKYNILIKIQKIIKSTNTNNQELHIYYKILKTL